MAREMDPKGSVRLAKFLRRATKFLRTEPNEQVLGSRFSERLACFVERVRGPLNEVEARACANPWLTAGLGHDDAIAAKAKGSSS